MPDIILDYDLIAADTAAKAGKPFGSGRPSGLSGFISWERLATEALRKSGEIRPSETVTAFFLNERGIHFHLKTD